MDKNWVESLRIWLERKGGRIYVIYLFLLATYNWKFSYVLLFSSQNSGSDRLGEALSEFTNRAFLPFSEFYILQFLIPAVLTWVVIEHLPKLDRWAYSKWLENGNEAKLLKHQFETKMAKNIEAEKAEQLESYATTEELQSEINSLISQVNELTAENPGIKTIRENSLTENWTTELEENPELKNVLASISFATYEHNGILKPLINGRRLQIVSPDELKLADSFSLVEFNEDRSRITLTEKAKYLNKLT